MAITVKVHKSFNGIIVTLCDSDLIGKKLEEGKIALDLSTQFYKGEEKSEDEIKKMIIGAYIINAVGFDSIAILKKFNLIDEKNIISVDGVPHVQCVLE
jgi:hypothetical protein